MKVKMQWGFCRPSKSKEKQKIKLEKMINGIMNHQKEIEEERKNKEI